MITIRLTVQQNDFARQLKCKSSQKIEFPEAVTPDALKQQLQDVFEAMTAPILAHPANYAKRVSPSAVPDVPALPPSITSIPPNGTAPHVNSPVKKLATEKQIAAMKSICAGHGLDPRQVARDHGVEKLEQMSSKDCWNFINQQSHP